jgi:hypothetical protein
MDSAATSMIAMDYKKMKDARRGHEEPSRRDVTLSIIDRSL